VACLSEDDALLFVAREADPPTLAATLGHIEGCSRCRQMVGEAARSVRPPATAAVAGAQLAGRYRVMGAGPHDTSDALDLRDEVRCSVRMLPALPPLPRAPHPHLRRLLDRGSDGAGAFVVLESIDGESLGERLSRRGPLPPGELVTAVQQVCGALEALGAGAGLGTRDVILRGPGDAVVDPWNRRRDWSARGDVRALGVILVEGLTGLGPLDPEVVVVGVLPTDVEPRLRKLVARCLDRGWRRLRSPGDVARALDQVRESWGK
jgi:hypothetical protein